MNATEETFEIKPNESALMQTRRAREAAAKAGAAALEKARTTAGNIGELEVACLNRLIEAGKQFNIACGREQLLFTTEGFEFARREILPHLAQGMTLDHVRAAVKLANQHPEPLRDVAELKSVKRELQGIMVLFDLAATPARGQLQNAHARNFFADVVSQFANSRVLFEKLEAASPMESWPREKLEEFITTAQPVEDRIVRAKKLLIGN